MATERIFKIESEDGLHARPAGLFVKAISPFKASVEVEFKGVRKNAKSIMSLMSLGVAAGDELKIIADGDDAELALTALQTLFDKKFQV